MFHCDSGDTHLLNAVAAESLRYLMRRPASVEQLAERVANGAGVEVDDDLRREIEAFVERLDRAGLIEPFDEIEGPAD